MIKYRASKYPEIKKIEIVRETESCIFLKGFRGEKDRRLHKVSEYESYHDTFDQAKQFLMDSVKKEIYKLNNQLDCYEKKLKEIESFKDDN